MLLQRLKEGAIAADTVSGATSVNVSLQVQRLGIVARAESDAYSKSHVISWEQLLAASENPLFAAIDLVFEVVHKETLDAKG